MITFTSVKVQSNSTLDGAMANKGLDESILSIPRVLFERDSVINEDTGLKAKAPCAIDNKIHGLMMAALSGIMKQCDDYAVANGANEGDNYEANSRAIRAFRLDSGSGFTALRKEQLIEAGTLDAVDFIAKPKKVTKTGGKAAVHGTIEL